jgi:hypothetical protein
MEHHEVLLEEEIWYPSLGLWKLESSIWWRDECFDLFAGNGISICFDDLVYTFAVA